MRKSIDLYKNQAQGGQQSAADMLTTALMIYLIKF